jgi:perosamine synthetase
MTDVQAAIGRAQLACLPSWQTRRAQAAARYDAALAGVAGLVLPVRPRYGQHAWHLYQVRIGPEYGLSRDLLIDALSRQGIGTSVHFIPVHHLSGFRRALGPEECRAVPVTDQVAKEILSLPIYPALTDAEVDYVAGALLARARQAAVV